MFVARLDKRREILLPPPRFSLFLRGSEAIPPDYHAFLALFPISRPFPTLIHLQICKWRVQSARDTSSSRSFRVLPRLNFRLDKAVVLIQQSGQAIVDSFPLQFIPKTEIIIGDTSVTFRFPMIPIRLSRKQERDEKVELTFSPQNASRLRFKRFIAF